MSQLAMIGMPGMQEWIIILVVVLVLFGGRKLPELARGLGQGLKEFKKAQQEASAEEESAPASATPEARS
jgi:sec-independent protein translocase protein TatA